MKKFLLMTVTCFLAVLMAACGNNSEKGSGNEGTEPIDVSLQVVEKAAVNEKISLKAIVKQGKEVVADADEVQFEIWEEGKKDDGQMKDVKNEKNGTYTSSISFDHDGVYNVQVHVTARGMHTMPKSQVVIGNAKAAK